MKTRVFASFIVNCFGGLLMCCAVLAPRSAVPATPAVVGLWRFNEGTGTNVSDASGLGNDGILMGENGNVPAWVAGQSNYGGALRFTNNGADHAYVNIAPNNALRIGATATNAWTVTAWVYEDSNGTADFVANYGRILVLDDGVALQIESGASGDAELYTWSELNAPWQIAWGIGAIVSPIPDQWVHWAVVYDGVNLKLYRNGNQGAQGGIASNAVTAALAIPNYAGAILIGSELDQTGDRTWNGMLDDVAVFAGALTQAQIGTVMAGDFSAFIVGPVEVVAQPQSVVVPQGAGATFSVGVAGQAPFQYQWYFNGTNKLANATDANLALTGLQLSDSGTYSVVVSNALGIAGSQPATLSVFQASLVGLWRFNEGTGTNALDSSGLENNGTLAGENGNVPAWVAGQSNFGGALRFTNNGMDHAYVNIPANGSLTIGGNPTNAWTVAAWAYEDSNGTSNFIANYGRVLVIDDGTAFQLESGASGDAQLYTWARANAAWQIPWGLGSPVAPLLDQWEHWAVVYDGTNLSVFRNGDQGADGGFAAQAVNAALGYAGYQGAIHIGSELGQTGDRTWNGMLDDVAVFSVALSPAQIHTVMTGDFSAFLPQPFLSVTPVRGGITLNWPAAQPGWQLQSSPNLASAFWTNVPASPATNGNVLTVTLPSGTGTRFFRLIGP